jgi:hypothetical protein
MDEKEIPSLPTRRRVSCNTGSIAKIRQRLGATAADGERTDAEEALMALKDPGSHSDPSNDSDAPTLATRALWYLLNSENVARLHLMEKKLLLERR